MLKKVREKNVLLKKVKEKHFLFKKLKEKKFLLKKLKEKNFLWVFSVKKSKKKKCTQSGKKVVKIYQGF